MKKVKVVKVELHEFRCPHCDSIVPVAIERTAFSLEYLISIAESNWYPFGVKVCWQCRREFEFNKEDLPLG